MKDSSGVALDFNVYSVKDIKAPEGSFCFFSYSDPNSCLICHFGRGLKGATPEVKDFISKTIWDCSFCAPGGD